MSSPPSGGPPTIDAAFFPHLMDMIISAAPLAALLNLQCTSHAFVTRVNLQLSRRCHMVIRGDAAGKVEYAFRYRDCTVVAKDIATAVALAPNINVLDFDARIDHTNLVDIASKLDLKVLEITRVLHFCVATSEYPVKSPTYVVSLDGFGPGVLPCDVVGVNPFPETTNRVVLNISTSGAYRYVSLNYDQRPLLDVPLLATQFVLIFSATIGPMPNAVREPYVYREEMLGLILAMLEQVVEEFLFVDLGFLEGRSGPGHVITPHSHNKINAFINHEAGNIADAMVEEGVERMDASCMSRDDYLDGMGARLFALVTMAPETMV